MKRITYIAYAFPILLILALLASPLFIPSASADTAIVTVTQDHYVASKQKSLLQPSGTLRTKGQASDTKWAYLQFEVSQIPANATGITATLEIYANTAIATTSRVHRVNNTLSTGPLWSESNITWNNKPGPTPDATTQLDTNAATSTAGYIDYNVSSHVNANGTYTVLLRTDGNTEYTWQGDEQANVARVQLSWTVPPPDPSEPPSEPTSEPPTDPCTDNDTVDIVTVPPTQTTVDGDTTPDLDPGDTLLLSGGNRGRLQLDDIHGTESCPILVTDAGVDVNINGSAGQYAGIEVNRSTHLQIRGSSHNVGAKTLEANQDASIIVTGTDRGLASHDRSEFIEFGYIEAHHTAGNPGVHFASQPETNYGSEGQRGTYLHDLYIHDIFDSEGFYLGESAWTGTDTAVELNGVRIENNLVVNSDYDGIQLGAARLDSAGPNRIKGNIVRHAGFATAAGTTHDKGIIINRGTYNTDVTHNRVEDTAGTGIYDQGVGGAATDIANNLVINSGQKYAPPASGGSGIRVSTGNPITGSNVHVFHNTVVNSAGWGVDYDRAGTGNRVQNNILFNNPSGTVDPETGMTASHNFTTGDPLFINPSAGDYHLQSGSPAIDMGLDLTSFGIIDDFDGDSRPQGSGWDQGMDEKVGA